MNEGRKNVVSEKTEDQSRTGVMLRFSLKIKEGATAKACRQLLKAGKGKEADSHLEYPEGTPH